MGFNLREIINSNQIATAAIIAVLSALALFAAFQAMHKPASQVPIHAFFTSDDGATVFEDDFGKVAPFDHNGHEAVRAHVFSADGGQHQWVQYLEKLSDKDKTLVDGAMVQMTPAAMARLETMQHLVKRPGDKDWIPNSDPKSAAIVQPVTPAGMGAEPPESVNPK